MEHKRKVLMLASVASMIDQFNMPNIRLMQELGCEVHVACNFKAGNTCSRHRIRQLKKILKSMGVVCHQWDCPRAILPLAGCMRAYQQLWELTAVHRYEWMHCHSPVGGVLARAAAYRRGIRVIYTAHGFHFYKGAPWKNWLLYYPVEKLLSYGTDVLITVNKEDYVFAKKNMGAGKIFRIPGVGVDIEKFASIYAVSSDDLKECSVGAGREESASKHSEEFGRKYQIPDGARVLLSVGELNAGKNHRAVMDTLAALKRKDVYYLICGQGALQDELERYACRLGVAGCVRMLGYQEDMPYIYQNADIFVFPSIREGMPVALIEAMAAGLPCVVSDIRGNRELIDAVDMSSISDIRGNQKLINAVDMSSVSDIRGNQKLINAVDMSSVSDTRGNRELIDAVDMSSISDIRGNQKLINAVDMSSVSDTRGNRELADDVNMDSDCPDLKERAVYRHVGGMRFALGQPQQLRKALEIMLDHAQLRQACGMHNQKKARKYAQAAVQEKMREIYEYIDTGSNGQQSDKEIRIEEDKRDEKADT